MIALLVISTRELDRLTVFERIKAHKLSRVDAAQQLGLSTRNVNRLYRQYLNEGPAALTPKRRGKPGNHAYAPELKQYALYLIRTNYEDFGPTLIAGKLQEHHGLAISRETSSAKRSDSTTARMAPSRSVTMDTLFPTQSLIRSRRSHPLRSWTTSGLGLHIFYPDCFINLSCNSARGH